MQVGRLQSQVKELRRDIKENKSCSLQADHNRLKKELAEAKGETARLDAQFQVAIQKLQDAEKEVARLKKEAAKKELTTLEKEQTIIALEKELKEVKEEK